MCVRGREREREAGMKEQALWSLEKEDLSEEVGGRASRKMDPAYGLGPGSLLCYVTGLFSLNLVFSSEKLLSRGIFEAGVK